MGLLSRATPLKTFKERSAFLAQQWAKAEASFRDFQTRLRSAPVVLGEAARVALESGEVTRAEATRVEPNPAGEA